MFLRCALPAAATAAAAAAAATAVAAAAAAAEPFFYSISVDGSGAGVLNTVDDHFLGVNIDTGSLYHAMDLTEPAYTALLRALAPGSLRVGGGAADALVFDPGGGYGAGPNIFRTGLNGQVTLLNASAWRAVTGLARAAGLALLFAVNGFAFREGVTWGAWNASGDVPPQTRACPACTRDAAFDVANGNLSAMLAQVDAEDLRGRALHWQ